MSNMTSFVINIKKIMPNQSDVSFMQFLLKNQIRFHDSGIYYIFRKEEIIIGFIAIADFLSPCMTKRLELFVNPQFEGIGVAAQMINFAVNDNEVFKFTSDVDSMSAEYLASFENSGFHVAMSKKFFVVKDADLKDKLPRCTVNTIAKSNKNLITQFEKELALIDRNLHEELADVDEEMLVDDIRDKFDYKNSFLYVKNGKVCGWALSHKPTSSRYTISRLNCIDESENFVEFLKDVAFTVFKFFVEIGFSTNGTHDEMFTFSQLFDKKPQAVIHTYSNADSDKPL